MIDKVPRFRAKRQSDGEYVEGSLIMREGSYFAYILTDDNFSHMTTDIATGSDCRCKLVRIMENTIGQIC